MGVLLARYTRSLLLGEGVTAEVQGRTLGVIEATPGVLKVTQFLSMHLGPEAIILALKVRFRPQMVLEELETVIDDIEARVRAELPEMKKIFVEPDSDYDVNQDAALKSILRLARSSRGFASKELVRLARRAPPALLGCLISQRWAWMYC